jgi:hypothetical protein
LTSYVDVYLSQTKAHQYIIGPSELHENPNALGSSFDFKSDLDGIISGVPIFGVPPEEFSPRGDVGIYYKSPHDLDLTSD